MDKLQSHPFGMTQTGYPVTRYVMEAGLFSVGILDYGGAVQMLRVPDRHGSPLDIALGFDTVAAYEQHDKFLGALIGRCANRVAHGTFCLQGTSHFLPCNEGTNHLHGGNRGFDKQVWQAERVDGGLRLQLHSENGDEGYPGRLDASVTYTLQEGALLLEYRATSDRDTLCNLTNHTYFNLSGHGSGDVLQQEIQIFAQQYTPVNPFSIPLGEIASVENTPLDLRTPQCIAQNINSDFAQLRYAGGFDHNWVIPGEIGTMRPAARVFSEETGIDIQVETTMPGIQFYSGNHLDGCPDGKDGARYGKHCGFCLETQFYPDAIHHANFPQPILHKGETYMHRTIYRFHT